MSKVTKAVFDTEGNGLLYDITQFWCIVIKDRDTREVFKYTPDRIEEGLKHLSSYDILIGHNICGFDVPAIKKLYPWWTHKKLRDTYCMSKLFNPERFGGHALESYGEQFKRPKPTHKDWSRFSEEMLYRCSEDVEINWLTYDYLVDGYCSTWNWVKSLEIEQEFAIYRAAQELEGVDIDVDHALRVIKLLDEEIEYLDKTLYEMMPMRVVPVGNKDKGTLPFKKDGTYNEITKRWLCE